MAIFAKSEAARREETQGQSMKEQRSSAMFLLHALFRWDIVRFGIIFNLFQCEMVCGHAAEQWKGREDEGFGWTILSRRVANIFTRI
jgi:hypothetical protein